MDVSNAVSHNLRKLHTQAKFCVIIQNAIYKLSHVFFFEELTKIYDDLIR